MDHAILGNDVDPHGERIYPAEQVKRLHLVKRLMDQGYRPGRLLTSPMEDLEELSAGHKATASAAAPQGADGLADLIELIRKHDAAAYLQALQQQLARLRVVGGRHPLPPFEVQDCRSQSCR